MRNSVIIGFEKSNHSFVQILKKNNRVLNWIKHEWCMFRRTREKENCINECCCGGGGVGGSGGVTAVKRVEVL